MAFCKHILAQNDGNEESDEHDAKIAVFTTMATMWIDGEDRGGRATKKMLDQTGTNVWSIWALGVTLDACVCEQTPIKSHKTAFVSF